VYTKSKITVDPDGDNRLLIDDAGRTVAIAATPYLSGSSGTEHPGLLADTTQEHRTGERIANCERLAACWNYCHGIATEVLEARVHMRKREVVLPRIAGSSVASRIQDDVRSAYEAVEPAPHRISVTV
jgi:hypothetical protein